MAETAGTARCRVNVVDNVVRVLRILRNSANPHEVVETELVAHAPSDVVVGAGSVTAHSRSFCQTLPTSAIWVAFSGRVGGFLIISGSSDVANLR